MKNYKSNSEEGECSVNRSTMPNDPPTIEQHWSHPQHPLELHELTQRRNQKNNLEGRKLFMQKIHSDNLDFIDKFMNLYAQNSYLHEIFIYI